jgi:16S rRNA (cytosine1402-N4)-methyltransferase
MKGRHMTVLRSEAVRELSITRGSIVVDATANGGGHSQDIAKIIGAEGRLIALDLDPGACAMLKELFKNTPTVVVQNGNFRNIHTILTSEGVVHADAILADLGWSTNQFESVEGFMKRGFSFMRDEPLLMTYGDPATYPFTAFDIINRWTKEDMANVFYGYGDERRSRQIADLIVRARSIAPIDTSGKLASLIETRIPRRGSIHPATKVFQSLRIAVNDELGALNDFIHEAFTLLRSGGRLAIITFHSTEDRIVKQAFKELILEGRGTAPHKKPITPSREEQVANPRSRSAHLRSIIKV